MIAPTAQAVQLNTHGSVPPRSMGKSHLNQMEESWLLQPLGECSTCTRPLVHCAHTSSGPWVVPSGTA